MTSVNTRAALALVTLLAAAAPAGIAFAAEGNVDPHGLDNSRLPVLANPIDGQTGSAHDQSFDRSVTERQGLLAGEFAAALL